MKSRVQQNGHRVLESTGSMINQWSHATSKGICVYCLYYCGGKARCTERPDLAHPATPWPLWLAEWRSERLHEELHYVSRYLTPRRSTNICDHLPIGDGCSTSEDEEDSTIEGAKQNDLLRSKILETELDSVFLHYDWRVLLLTIAIVWCV